MFFGLGNLSSNAYQDYILLRQTKSEEKGLLKSKIMIKLL